MEQKEIGTCWKDCNTSVPTASELFKTAITDGAKPPTEQRNTVVLRAVTDFMRLKWGMLVQTQSAQQVVIAGTPLTTPYLFL